MEYYVYIIRSEKDGRFYTGLTNDFDRRFREHNVGRKGTPSMISRGPFKLVYKEKLLASGEARRREKFLKSGAGREWRNKFLIKNAGLAHR